MPFPWMMHRHLELLCSINQVSDAAFSVNIFEDVRLDQFYEQLQLEAFGAGLMVQGKKKRLKAQEGLELMNADYQ